MKNRKHLRFLTLVALLMLAGVPAVSYIFSFMGNHSLLPSAHAALGPHNNLGIDCAYGASADPPAAFPTPITTKDSDGVLDTSCQWALDVDGDGGFDPLVSDNVALLPAGSGGGFMADVIIRDLNTTVNGYDQTISFDPHVLNAVLIDQSGLTFGGNVGCTAVNRQCTLQTASTIDNSLGQVRLVQALLAASIGPGGNCDTTMLPTCTATTQTLFRIRFDVVGAGSSPLSFATSSTANVITNPGVVPHFTQDGSFSTNAGWALVAGVSSFLHGYNVSWTFSPNPEVPGSALSLTAAASCGNCTLPFSYSWDFNSYGDTPAPGYVAKVNATGQSVNVPSPPRPIMDRITLTVTDAVGHSVTATRRLPLAVVAACPTCTFSNGAFQLSQSVAAGPFIGKWLGGVTTVTPSAAGYSGQWRFCPGSSLVHPICAQWTGSAGTLFTQTPGATGTAGTITQNSTFTSVSINFAGLYHDFMQITDTTVTQIAPTANVVQGALPLNVTGTTPAYTISASPNVTSVSVNKGVNVTASITYATAFSTQFRSTQFSYTFFWGDLSSTFIPSGSPIQSAVHTYSSTGTFVVKVVARAIGAVDPSQIQENGFSPPITVGILNPTVTAVTCTPSSVTVGSATSCNAVVNDVAATGRTVPTGTVSFTVSPGPGTGIPGTCTLGGITGNTTAAQCAVSYTPSGTAPRTDVVTGNYGGDATHSSSSGTFNLGVQPAAFSFTLAASPSSLSITDGGAGGVETATATLTSTTTAPVTFSILTALPTGVTASAFTNSPCNPTCSATVTFTAAANAPASSTSITIQATGSGVTQMASFTLVVSGFFDFTLAASPASLTITDGAAGGVETATATLNASATTAPVTFSILTTLPTGVTAIFLNNPCSPTCSATVTLTASATAPASTTVITIQATGGTPVVTHTATFTLVVSGFFDFTLAASPASLSITDGAPGGVETATATLNASATTSPVTFSILTALPSGVTASAFTNSPCSPTCSATVTFTAAANAPASSTLITIQATGGSPVRTHTATFTLVVSGFFDFTLAAGPASLSITDGAAGGVETATATLNASATTSPVTFSILTALPSGVTASAFSNSPCSPTCSATVTFTAAANAPASSTLITIQATGGSPVRTHTATFTLVVSGFFDFTLAASPSSLSITDGAAGGVETATATLNASATTSPVTFSILTVLPSGVTASAFTSSPCSPTCSATVTFTAAANAPASSTVITIQATGGSPVRTHTATFTLVVSGFFDFTLAASPASLSITDGAPGGVETATATLNASATTSPVTFSILTALPTGVTASAFSNSPCSPTCSATVTFTAAANAPASSTIITVQATGGSPVRTHTATFTLVVSGFFDFALAASPASLSITDGAAGGVETATATLNASATTSPVTFSILTALPTGVTASAFTNSPCSPTCSATVTLTAAANAPASSTLITVQATGGTPVRTHTATFTLVVSGFFDFTLAASPSTLSITDGATGGVETATATLNASATTSPVTFSILTTLPSGVTASAFTNSPCSPTCSATVTLTAAKNAPASSTLITIQATGGSPVRTHTATFTLVVSGFFDFTLAASPASLSITDGAAGGVETATATLNASATTSPVTFSILTALPSGVTASAFTNSPCSPTCSATVTFTASATAPASTTVITIQATGGTPVRTHTATFTLVVSGFFDFTLAASPATLTITDGTSGGVETATATLNASATTSPVTFSILTALPSGVTASAFSNSPCSPTCSATVTFTASATAPASSTVITIQATGGSPVRTHTATFTLVVAGFFDFTLAASPASLSITDGATGGVETATATLNATATTTPVTFSILTTLPTGVTASAFSNSPCSPTCSATVTLTAAANAPASSTVITIQAVGGGRTHTATFTLVVSGFFDFTLAASPASLSITDGATGGVETATATLNASATTSPVTFSILTTLPSGVTASAFTNSPCSPTCSATVTLTAAKNAPASTTVISIQATGGSPVRTHTTTFTLVVSGFFDFTLAASPSTLSITDGAAGAVETATATLNASATTSPVTFSILTTLPSGVTASAFTNSPCSPTCSATVTLTASANAPASTTIITIQATGGSPVRTHTATFTLVVSGFFDFTLAASPASLSITDGAAGSVETATATLNASATTSPVTFSILTTLPTGVTASAFTNSPCSPTCSATITFTAAANAPASSTLITVQATGGTPVRTHTATFTLVVSGFFDFTLAASPASLSITDGAAGGVETATATLNASATTSPVTFSILTTLPSGVTASAFTNSPCSPTCSATVTLTAAQNAPASTTIITIQSTGGSPVRTHTATFTLVVSGFFDFTLAASPSSLAITDGAAGAVETATATLNASATTTPVTFSVLTTLPSGVTASAFSNSPCSPTCSATVTFTASATAPASSTVITIQATGGSPVRTHTATFTLVVSGFFDFTLAASPTTLTITDGTSGGVETATATLNASATTSPVTFSILTALPSGVTASAFSNSPCSPTCSATVTFTASATAPASSTVITIQATGGSPVRTHTATFTLVVAGFFDFTLAASPASLSITDGATGGVETATATLNATATTTPVTFSILTTLPTGVTASAFTNSPCSPTCSATVTFTAAANAPASSTVITIQAVGGGRTHTATFTLVVSGFFDFTLAASPASLSITDGAAGSVETVTATLNASATTSPVTFSILTALPSGVTASAFTNSPCSPTCSATVTFTASANAPASSTVLTVQATGGSPVRTHTATFTLVVSGFFDFTLAASPASLSITDGTAGGVETATATLNASATTSPVTFSVLTTLPTGVTASAFTNSPCSPTCSATVTFTAAKNAPASSTLITIQATGGSPVRTHTATFTLVVSGFFDFTLAASPASLSITDGATGGVETATATLNASATASPVTFSILTALPTGVIASAFTNSPCSPTCSATVTFTASATAPASSTVITIQATGGTPVRTHTATFTLVVSGFFDFTLAASPASLSITDGAAGGVETATATLNASATTSPVTFSILTTLPTGVTASAFSNSPCSPTCSATVTFTASATAPASSTVITIQATGGSPVRTHTATFTLVVSGFFDFTLAASPASLSITDGATGGVETATATLNASATTSPVTFSILTTLPSGVTASAFTNSPCSPTCSATVTFTAAANAPASTTVITLQATGGSPVRTHTATFTLVVSGFFDFTLAASPSSLTISAGGSGGVETATATLNASATTSPVTFSILTTLPTGVSASAFTNSPCSPTCSATVTFTASSTAPASSTVITIQATGGTPVRTHTATFTLVVSSFDFSLAASPASLSITDGASGGVETATATLATGATAAPVTFSILTALPTGVTASAFSNSPCSPTCSATVTLTASATAPASSTVITIQASGGSPTVTHTTTFTLVVSGFFDFTLAASPASLSISDGATGGVETATATLNASATTSPVTFSILTALPSGVTASAFTNSPCSPTCSATATFTAAANAPASSTVITVQATGGTPVRTHTATFTLVVSGFFDFTLAASPSSLSITDGAAGAVETATATLNASAITSPVTFSILTTLPTGVTASAFTNSPCSPTCSATVTLTAAKNAPASSTLITIQATGGSPVRTHTATFTLVVSGFFDFTLAASPATLTITDGTSGGVETATATLNASATTSPVTFSILTALPSGVTASAFTNNPCSPTCSATVTFTASATAPASSTVITIQATGGSPVRTHTATFTLVVAGFFDFTLAASPASLSITDGATGGVETATATLNATATTTPVTFSILTTLPAGVTASTFSNSPCSPTCSATVTLTASATAPASSTVITIQAVGGGRTHTATFTLVVSGFFDFTLAASPASLSITDGATGGVETVTATLNASATTSPVTFSLLTTLPTGVTASAFTNSPCSPTCSATVTFTASATAPASSTVITVQATGGSPVRTHTATFTLVVSGFFDFTLAASPSTLAITDGAVGGVETATATLNASATTSPVTFSILTTLPSGVTASAFTNSPCSPTCSATVTLTAAKNAPASTTVITIQATGGSPVRTHTTTFTLVVSGFFDFTLAASPSSLSITDGATGGVETATATLNASATTSPVTFSILTTLPSGVTASAFTNSPCSPTCSATVTFTASANAPASSTVLTVQATGGSPVRTHTATFTLVVSGFFDFTLAASPTTLTITDGTSGGVETATATLNASATTSPVTFSLLTTLPTGVTASVFSNSPCSPTCSATVTFTASATAPASSTVITIQATGGSPVRTHTATFTLVVAGFFDFTLAASPASLSITDGATGGVETATATLNATATTTPVTFSILTALPSGVTASAFTNSPCSPTCSATVTLTAAANAPASSTVITIQAVGGGRTHTATFTLVVSGFFDFTLAASPSSLTISAGGSGGVETATATLNASATTTPVTFSILTTLPTGVTAVFANSPCSPTCSATVTFTASSTAPSSSTVITIQATGGSPVRTHTATFTLVVSSFDFTLAASPATLSITDGAVGGVETATATLATGATTTPVTFSILTTLPSGVTASAFSNSPCSPTCSATVTLTASATAPASTTVITIQASGGSSVVVTKTTTFTLVVSGFFDFTLAASPSSLSITDGAAGGVETATATLNASATTSPVTFSILTTLPSGVTASAFTNSPCSPTCSATVTLTASATAPASTTVITIQATGGTPVRTHTATFTLVVSGFFDFTLAASPATLSITDGATGGVETATATLATGATTTPVTFSILTTLPSGVTASAFSNSPCSPTCSATVTFTASATAPASSTVITIQATGGTPAVTRTAMFTLVVSGFFDFSLAASPSSLTISAGGIGGIETATATLATGATTTPVTFTILTTLPAGVTASSFSNSPCSPTCSATVTFTAAASAPASSTVITIQASGGTPAVNRTASFTLVVSSFDFTLAASPSTLAITDGAAGGVETATATLATGATTTPVSFTILTTLPTGVTASAFSNSPCSPTCSATVTLTASATAPASSTVITIQASGGTPTVTHTATFTLVVSGFFDFTLAASPATLSIADGAAGGVETATATLNASATTAPVTFSILTTLPTGVTASAFTNSPCSPTCSATITLTASATAPASSTVITIQATGGSPVRTHTAIFTLVVSGFFDFTLAASPASLSITDGATGGVETATATLATGATTTPVTFSILTTLPSGVTASAFSNSPCSPTCSATVTLTASATAPASTTVITIQATGGTPAVTRTAMFTLVVSGFFDFTLAASPSSLAITAGGAGGVETATATLATGATTTPVTFSILTALPTGVTASAFTNSPCSPTCSATVTFTAASNAPASSTVITIQATGGTPAVTRTATFTLVVTTFDFTLAASPSTLAITDGAPGGVEMATATLSSGVTTPVTFSIVTSLPSGVTASAFSNSPCSPTCSATVTLTASATAPASTTVITIQASGGSPTVTHTATFTLVVSGFFDFTLAASPSTLTVTDGAAGSVETATATLATGATTAPVTFSILTALPSGVTASAFSNSPCSPTCSAMVTFTASATAPASSTVITIQATGGTPAVTHTAMFTLVVSGFFDFTPAASPTTLSITDGAAGGVETTTVTLAIGATTASVTFSVVTALPTGVTASTFSNSPCSPTCSATVTFTASATAPASSTVITIQATGGTPAVTHTATFTLMVSGFFDFTLAASPATLPITAGGASGVETATATLATGATTAPVTFSILTTLPSGVTASAFSNSPCSPTCSATVTFTAAPNAPASTTLITIQATGGTPAVTRTATFTLAVTPQQFDYSLAWSPNSAIATGAGTFTITPGVVATLTQGQTQTISCSLSVPVVVGLSAGPTSFSLTPTASQSITITTTAFTPSGIYTIGVSCTGGIGSHSANFTLNFTGVPFDYTLAWSPSSTTVNAGTSTTSNVVATLTQGQTQSISCTVSVPAVQDLSASPLMFSLTPTMSQMVTISTTVFTPGGTYTISVSCTGGVGSHTANYMLTVIPAQFNFSLAASQSTLNITTGSPGGVETATATLTSGVASAVTFSITTSLPTGVTASAFTNSPCSPTCSATVTFTASATAPASSTVITIQATGGSPVVTQTATFTLNVSVTADSDGDGIPDNMDCGVVGFSNCFTDVSLGGTTSGTILSRGDQCPSIPCQLTFAEVSPSVGILITSGSAGGLTPASISVCGGASILSVPASTSLTVKCGTVTITVLTGTVGVTFVGTGSQAGVTGTATISAGNSVTFDPTTFGFSAPATNATPIVVTINGQTLTIAPGQSTSTPFPQFSISVVNPKGEVFAAGAVLKFDGKASFATIGPITNFVWNFGDGTIDTSNTAKLTHTYATAGTFTVTLTVTDNFGHSNFVSQTINVLPAPLLESTNFLKNLQVGINLVQNFTVEVFNPNSYAILVNVNVSGNCDTVCPFSVSSGPVMIGAGQTIFISLTHTFSPLDQGATFLFQVKLTFTSDTSNMNVSTYTLAATVTGNFRVK